MSLYDRARQDNSRILGTGFSIPVVFTDPSGIECPVNAFFRDVDFALDANGFPMIAHSISISVNLLAPDGTVQFTNAHKPADGWLVSFTYNGLAFVGEVIKPMFDRTLGMITMNAQKRRSA